MKTKLGLKFALELTLLVKNHWFSFNLLKSADEPSITPSATTTCMLWRELPSNFLLILNPIPKKANPYFKVVSVLALFINSMSYSICLSQPADAPIIDATASFICSGSSVTLSIDPTSDLHDNNAWTWYSGSCGGTALGLTGTSININPIVTTTYYARGEGGSAANGPCNTIGVIITIIPNLSTGCFKVLSETVTRISCQEYSFNYQLKNMSPCSLNIDYNGYALKVDLSSVPGLAYVGLSSTLSELDITSNPAIPVFVINTIWTSCTTIDFTFTVSVPCFTNGNNFLSTLSLSCPDFPYSTACSAQPNSAFSLLPPQIDIEPVQPNFYNVGDYGTRQFKIENIESQIDFDGKIEITISDECDIIEGNYWFKNSTGLETSHNPIGSSTIILDLSIFNPLLGHAFMSPGEIIMLFTDFTVSSCSSTNCNASYIFVAECMNETCFSETIHSNININPAPPSLSVTLGVNDNTSFCSPPSSANATFVYKNTGPDFALPIPAGNASLTNLKIYLSWDVAISNPVLNSIKLNGALLTTLLGSAFNDVFHPYLPLSTPTTSTYVIDFSFLPIAIVPSGCGLVDLDGDGMGDDLRTNQELELNIDYDLLTPAGFSLCNNDLLYLILGSKEYFSNQCGEYLNPFPTTISSHGNALKYQSSQGNASLSINPQDILGSGNLTATICPGSNQIWSVPPFTFEGAGFFPKYELRLLLPVGYHLPPGTTSINLSQDMGFSDFTATVDETVPGIVIIHIPNNISGPGLGVFNTGSEYQTAHITCFNLTLQLDCSETDASSNSTGAVPDQFSFKYVYMNGSCSEDILSCASDQIFHHCPGDCVSPISTEATPAFTFQRLTLGWINPTTVPSGQGYYTYADLPAATFVSPTSDIHLDRAYPKDIIHASAYGILLEDISHYNAVYFSLFYSPVGNTNIFELESGTITAEVSSGINIFNVETTPTFHAPVAPHNLCEYRFKIDPTSINYNNIIGGSLHAEINLKVLPNIPDYSTTIQTVRADFRAETNASNPPSIPNTIPQLYFDLPGLYSSCDPYSASPKFNVLKPSAYIEIPEVTSNCEDIYVVCQLKITPARIEMLDEDFPNEFRPYSSFGSHLEYNIPIGYEYSIGTAEFNNRFHPPGSGDNGFGSAFGGSSSAPGWFAVTPNPTLSTPTLLVFDGITGVPGSEWPLMDLGYAGTTSSKQSLRFKLKPTCSALPSSIACVEHSQTDFVQQLTISNLQTTSTLNCTTPSSNAGAYQTLLHINPSLTIYESGTVSSIGNNIVFTFPVCNNGNVLAPYSWIAIPQPVPSLYFGTAERLDPITLLPLSPPLNVSTVGSNFYIQLGDLPPAPNGCMIVRLTTTLKPPCVDSPTPQSLVVSCGFGCDGYPNSNNPPNTTCVNGSSITTTFDIDPSGLNFSLYPGFVPSNPVFSCDQITLSFLISDPVPGDILNPIFYIVLPTGVTYLPTGSTSLSIYDPHDGSTPTNIDSPPSLLPNGLIGWSLGSTLVGLHQIRVDITLQLTCDYNPNDYIEYHAYGVRNCGEIVDLDYQYRPTLVGARRADQIEVTSSITESALTCTNFSTVTLDIQNNGPATVNSNFLELEVPNIFNPTGFTPLVQTGFLTGSTTTTYTFAIGTIPSSGIDFQFDIQLSQTTVPCIDDVSNFRYNVFYTYTALCSPGVPCSTVTLHSADQYLLIDACCECSQYSFTLVPTTSPTCFGTSQGSVNVNVSSAIPDPYNFSWTGPTSIGNSTGSSASATGLSAGSYTVTSTDQFGCLATAPFTINSHAEIFAYVVNDIAICYGTSISLGASSISGNNYVWSPATGLNDYQISNPVATPLVTTTYTLTEIDPNGCTNSNVVTVTVNPLPIVTASATAITICFNDPVTLTGGGANTYIWSGGVTDGVSFNPSTTNTYVVTGTDINLCSAQASITVTVNPLPIVTASASANPVCLNDALTLTGGGANSYAWSGGVSNGVPFNPSTSNTYVVTGTDANNCSAQASIAVTVNPLPQPSAGNDATICSGTSIQIGIAPNPGSSYSWSPPDDLDNPNSSNPNASPTVSTAYNLTETVDATGCHSTVNVTIFVLPSPDASAGSDLTICNGTTVQIGDVPISGTTYLWNPTTNLSSNTASNPLATPSTTTIYQVTATGANLCSSSDDVNITVNPLPVINITAVNTLDCWEPVELTASGADTYVWAASSTLNPLVGSVVIASPLSTTTYSVTGTSQYGCISSSSISVQGLYEGECVNASNNTSSATPPYYITTLDCYDHSTDWGNSITGTLPIICDYNNSSGTKFAINGTFYIDNNFTFQNMYLQMGSDAKIVVLGGAVLNILGSAIIGCQMDPWVMWDGIYVEAGGSLIMGTTCVYDAKNAIVSEDGGYFNLQGSTFDHNYKCVVVNAFPGNHSGTISGCNFLSTGPLRPPFQVEPRCTTAVELNDVQGITIGPNGWTCGVPIAINNLFDGPAIGIRVNRSNAEIFGNSFWNFVEDASSYPSYLPSCCASDPNCDPGCNPPVTGRAIWDSGNPPYQENYLRVGKFNSCNYFRNTSYGVWSENSKSRTINAAYNTFLEINSGIVFKNCYAAKLTAEYNTMDNFSLGTNRKGIVARHCQGNTGINISNNQINNSVSGGWANAGIAIENCNLGVVSYNPNLLAPRTVFSNIVLHAFSGILAQYSDKLDICSNRVNLNEDDAGNSAITKRGIYLLTNPGYNLVRNNTIAVQSQHGFISDNSLFENLIGIRMYQNKNQTLQCNYISDMGSGIYALKSNPGSQLKGNYLNYGFYGVKLNSAVIGNQGSGGFPWNNRWQTNVNAGTYKIEGNVASTTFWYSIQFGATGVSNLNTNVSGGFVPAPGDPPGYSCPVSCVDGDKIVVRGIGYEAADILPSLRESIIGSIVRGERNYSQDSLLFSYYDKQFAYRSMLDESLLLNLGTNDDSLYQNFYAEMSQSGIGIMERVRALIADENFLDATIELAGLIPANQVESNFRIVNAIYLNTVATEIPGFNEDQYPILENIAYSDVFSDGDAVVLARILLGINPEDESVQARRGAVESNPVANSELSFASQIFPNPNSGAMQMNYSLGTNEKAELKIYDVMGTIKMKFDLEEGTNSLHIDAKELSSGVYLYKLSLNNASHRSGKIVILK